MRASDVLFCSHLTHLGMYISYLSSYVYVFNIVWFPALTLILVLYAYVKDMMRPVDFCRIIDWFDHVQELYGRQVNCVSFIFA